MGKHTRSVSIGLALALVAIIISATSSRSQTNSSGGSVVTANIGTTNGLALDATLTGGSQKTKLVDSGGTNAASVSAGGALKVDGSAVTQPISGTVTINPIPTGSAVIGTVNTIDKTACGNTVASQPLAALPTTPTVVFSSATCLKAIVINNTNGSNITVTITDNQGTPINDYLAFTVAPGQVIQPLYGLQFTSGVKWSASTTGVTGGMTGYQ
jgi:hypothetical protein